MLLSLEGEGIHLYLLDHGEESVGARRAEMLRQSYLVDEIEWVVKDFVRRGTLEHLGQQGYDALDYHGVTVGGEVDVSRVVHGGIKPHAALASFDETVGSLELFVHRLELVAEVYEEAVSVHPVVKVAEFFDYLVLSFVYIHSIL